MATRYWVGGTGVWDGTDTSHWSTSSGGASGASVPTATDDVIFDSASSATDYTVTLNPNAVGFGYTTGNQLVITSMTSGTFAVNDRVSALTSGTSNILNPVLTISSIVSGSGGVGYYSLSDLNTAYGSGTSGFMTVGTNTPICENLTISGPASGNLTMDGSAPLSINGSLTLPATGFVRSFTSPLYFISPNTGNTITTNGVDLVTGRSIVYYGSGEWTLGSAITASSGHLLIQGTLNTGGFNMAMNGAITTVSTPTKALNLSSSTITGAIDFTINTGFTFNAETSTINLNGTTTTLGGGGQTFNNVDFSGGAGTKTISGTNTFNNLSFSNSANTVVTFSNNQTVTGNTTFAGANQNVTLLASTFNGLTSFTNTTAGQHVITTTGGSFTGLTIASVGATGNREVAFGSNITVTGTLTLGAANTAIRRMRLITAAVGTRRTITLNGTLATLNDVDFREIGTAGTAGTWTGTRLGDLRNNTGITFTAGATKFWNLAAGGSWSATAWALSSGGAVDVNNFPLAQDSVVIENTGLNTSATVTIDATWAIPTISFATRSNAMTWASGSNSPTFYGNITLSSVVTISGTGTFFFAGRNVQDIISAGRTFTQAFTLLSPTGTFRILDAFNSSNATAFTVTQGTLNCNNFNFTAGGISSSNTTTRTVTLGSGTITLTGATAIDFTTTTGLTFNANTSTIVCSNASPTIIGGGRTFNNVSMTTTGASTKTIRGANTFNNLSITSTSGTRETLLIFGDNQTINGTLTLGAANLYNRRIFVYSDTVGTRRTLTVASMATLADVDFRDIGIAGTAAPVSGTRLGNGTNNSGITFDAPKTVYWNLAGGGSWESNAWALTSGGAVSTANYPLPQDICIFEDTGLNSGATITITNNWMIGELNFSTRTLPVTFSTGTQTANVFGNITLSSAVTVTGTGQFLLTDVGATQIITSAGVTIPVPINCAAASGTVQLADNLNNTSTTAFALSLGTLDLNNQTLTCVAFNSNNTNVRTIAFGTSGKFVITGGGATIWTMSNGANATITGTSRVECTYSGAVGIRTITVSANVPVNTYITAGSDTITTGGTTWFQTLDFTGFTGTFSNVVRGYTGDLILNSSMIVSGGTGTQTFGATSGIQTINTGGQILDFPITVNGTTTFRLASNVEIMPSRNFTLLLGTLDLNGFNLTTGLVNSSGTGVRSIAFNGGVINVTGSAGIISNFDTLTNFTYTGTPTINLTYPGSIGTRSVAMGITDGTESNVMNYNVTAGSDIANFLGSGRRYRDINLTGFSGIWSSDNWAYYVSGNVTIPAGITTTTTSSYTGPIRFTKTTGTQTLTTNGLVLPVGIAEEAIGGTLQLQDNLTTVPTANNFLLFGTIDANNYNLSLGTFNSNNSNVRTLNMGSGTWTLTGTSNVWNIDDSTNATLNASTSTIVIADDTTATKIFRGGGLTYNNLVIDGVTSSSTTEIRQSNTFNGRFSSTKPVAHTINFENGTTNTFANWAIRGFIGALVSLNVIGGAGAFTLNSTGGIVSSDYLSITNSTATPSSTWYAGANSVDNGGNTGWIFAYAPLRYWVGGSGDWDATSTTNWAVTSGGPGGVTAPTSIDDVFFDANSNVGTGAFTVTVTGTSAIPSNCKNFTAGSLDGAMTLLFNTNAHLDVYGSILLPATNFTWTGATGCYLKLRGTGSNTITTNGVPINETIISAFAQGSWSLGSALSAASSVIDWQIGNLTTNNYNITTSHLLFQVAPGTRNVSLGSSVLTLGSATPFTYTGANLTFNAGTSTINCTNASATFNGGGLTFYDVAFTDQNAGVSTINGANTYNNLTQASRSGTGVRTFSYLANQVVNGVLTLGTANTTIRRIQVRGTYRVRRTMTVNGSVAPLNDVDFMDVGAAGTAGTWTGTRLGDGLNNNNITLSTPKTVFWNLAGGGNWSSTAWALTSGGAVNINNFPLMQDTAIIQNTGLNTSATVTMDQSWWLGTVDASTRTNAMTLAWGNSDPFTAGDFRLSSSITVTQATTPSLTFVGFNKSVVWDVRSPDFPVAVAINPNGAQTGASTVTLGSNITSSAATVKNVNLTSGTLDLASFTLSYQAFTGSNSNPRTLAFGTGNITVTGNAAAVFNIGNSANLTVSGSRNVFATYAGGTGTRSIAPGTLDEGQALNYYITAGTDTIVTGSSTSNYNTLDFTGFSGTLTNLDRNLFGNLVLSTGMTFTAGTSAFYFKASSGVQTITTAGKVIDNVVKEGAGTLQLLDNLSMAPADIFTLTQGTLDLNNNTLTTWIFNSSNTNTRSIAFGTSKIVVTGNNAVVWNLGDATNFTYTGTSRVEATYSGSVGTRQIVQGVGSSESNVVNIYVTAGTDTISGTLNVNTFDLTGFTGTVGEASRSIYGNLSLTAGTTWSPSAVGLNFLATSGTQNITTNGVVIDQSIGFSSTGTGIKLQDNLTLASTRTVALNAGTLNANNFNLSLGAFSSNNSNTRAINFGSGTWTIAGAWNTATSTGLTTTPGTATINMTSASAKTFQGGGATFPTLNQGGLGALSITGSNTFTGISNTVQPTTLAFTAGATTTVTNFTVSGTAGNLVTLNSGTTGAQFFLVKTNTDDVSVDYLNIRDSNASPNYTWFAGTNSIDSGNNTGWFFTFPTEYADETFTLTDTNVGGYLILRDVVETQTLTDVQTTQANFVGAVSETQTLTDVQTTQANFVGAVSETQTLTDTQSVNADFVVDTTETQTLTDSQVGNAGFGLDVSESMTITDSQSSLAVFANVVEDTIILLDSYVRFGWFAIDDSQNASWGPVDDSQVSNWTDVNDNQTSNWVDVNDTQV